MRCVFTIATEAREIVALQSREVKKPYNRRRDMASEAAKMARDLFWQSGALQESAYEQLQLDEWHGAEAQNRILTILGKAPGQPSAHKASRRAAEQLVRSWKSKYDDCDRRERNIEADIGLAHLIEQFLLRAPLETATLVSAPVVEAVDRHPDDAGKILLGILHCEDRELSRAE